MTLCLQVGTPAYDQEYEAVKLFGYKNSTARDPYQQETPHFWADDVSECSRAYGISIPAVRRTLVVHSDLQLLSKKLCL